MLVRILCLLLLLPGVASAHLPARIEPGSPHEVVQIDQPEVAHAFYGDLQDFPHTYSIVAEKPFTLSVEILVPDIERAENIVSGIIVRQKQAGGVEEIARLPAQTAAWEPYHEPWGNDTYRRGPRFEKELDPGSYLVEMSTPDNRSPYVLSIGPFEELADVGYVESIRRMIAIKEFFGKSQYAVLLSPLIYIPLIIFVLFVAAVVVGIRRRTGMKGNEIATQ